MGTDFSKINADKAQQIINALKDGKINSNEAKDLKLTPEEAAALNEAFSSGEARIGDFTIGFFMELAKKEKGINFRTLLIA